MEILRPYGMATSVMVPMIKAGGQNFAGDGDWTPASGDVRISKDGGSFVNVTNLPTIASGAVAWLFTFTAAEMTAQRVTVVVTDAAPKAVEDQAIIGSTYGHASAQHPNLGTMLTPAAVWTHNTRTLTSGEAPTTADIWSHSARTLTADPAGVTTLLGRVVGTLATGTHQPQSGDAFARIGANGAGLTALGDTRISNIDAPISSRSNHTAAGVWASGTRTLTAGTRDAAIDAIKAKTDNLPSSPAATGAAMTLTSAYDAAKNAASQTQVQVAAEAAIAAKLPSGSALIAGAGTRTKNLDQIVITGVGSVTYTYTLRSSVDNSPISDVDVYVYTDIPGTNLVATAKTNAFGICTFFLDPGTYYFWRQKAGWNFINPDTEIVS